MAFTNAEKARIRSIGGWGTRWTQTETRLEASMNTIGTHHVAEESLIRDYLSQLTTLDGLISEAHGMVGVKQTGSIVLDDSAGVMGLRSEGARLVDAIYAILECDIKRNLYRSGSPSGGRIQYG